MSKANKYFKQAQTLQKQHGNIPASKTKTFNKPVEKPVNFIALKVGEHQFRIFDDYFDGARYSDYPSREVIPTEFFQSHNIWRDRASKWFHIGGSMTELGIDYNIPSGLTDLQEGDYWVSVKIAIQMLQQSFDIPHDVKMATVAWCMSEWMKEV